MIDHGTKCDAQPCTCWNDAYQQGYQQGLRDSFPPPDETPIRGSIWPLCYQRHELAPGIHVDIPHTHERIDLDTPGVRNVPGLDYPQGIQQRHARLPKHNVLCIGCKDCPPDPLPTDCPLFCTKHNHEEMGG